MLKVSESRYESSSCRPGCSVTTCIPEYPANDMLLFIITQCQLLSHITHAYFSHKHLNDITLLTSAPCHGITIILIFHLVPISISITYIYILRSYPRRYLASKSVWVAIVRILWTLQVDVMNELDRDGSAIPVDRPQTLYMYFRAHTVSNLPLLSNRNISTLADRNPKPSQPI